MKNPLIYLPAPLAHRLGQLYLQGLNFKKPNIKTWRPFKWKGLHFTNPLGPSGGVDKNAQFLKAWWASGAGFVEVGTCTPRPQKANPHPNLARHPQQQALWNCLGFPNHGAARMAQRLHRLQPYITPVLVNIGKNRNTPLPKATQDYLLCMHLLAPVADAFVVNISSPNTQGLRELLTPQNLKNFLTPIAQAKNNASINKPVLLKLSPDVTLDELKHALDTSLQLGLDGWVLANTSTQFNQALGFPQRGGVSGAPLREQALQLLQSAHEHLKTSTTRGPHEGPLLISSGGVLTQDDVHERLQAGAHLIQVYTALVYHGPSWFNKAFEHDVPVLA